MRLVGICFLALCWPSISSADSGFESNSSPELSNSPEPNKSPELGNSPEPNKSPELENNPEINKSPELTHVSVLTNTAGSTVSSVSVSAPAHINDTAPTQRSHYIPPSVRQRQQLEPLALKQLQILAIVPHYAEMLQPEPSAAAPHTSVNSEQPPQRKLSAFWRQQGLNLADISQVLDANFSRVVKRVNQLISLQQQPWPQITPGGWLRPNDSHRALPLIAQRLWLLGDVFGTVSLSNRYDDALVQAVQHFQQRHGLKVDGVIGPKTLYWLNRTPLQRAQQLVEQYVQETSLIKRLPDDYLLVNVPQFELKLIAKQQLVLRSNVVVGLPYRQTPLLQSEISSVVLNPAWHVPRSIVRRTILPKLRQNGDYLAQQGFDVYDWQGNAVPLANHDWATLARGKFHYRLVQQPSELNSLGRYKFHFSNSYAVYLHDTPEKALFSDINRARSSGCVRVDKAAELAYWLADNAIADKKTWREMQFNRQTTQWFKLAKRMPVYIVYWTAWVDKHGVAQFRDDIYRKQTTEIADSAPLTQ